VCFIKEGSSILKDTHFFLAESMPSKCRNVFVFMFNYSAWMTHFALQFVACCIYVQQLNIVIETHGI